jgi:predicted DNA binding CopG/RHH family protein
MKKAKRKEITVYDSHDVSDWINPKKKLSLNDLGLKLPLTPPSQVVSIRFPTPLLNQLKAKASKQDIPYQALIKMTLLKSLTA